MMKFLVLALCFTAATALTCNSCITQVSDTTDVSDVMDVIVGTWQAPDGMDLCEDYSDVGEECDETYDSCVSTDQAFTYGEDEVAGVISYRMCGKSDKSQVNWDCSAIKAGLEGQEEMTLGECTDTYCTEDNCNNGSTMVLFSTLLIVASALFTLN